MSNSKAAPRKLQVGDKVIFRLSAKYLAAMIAYARDNRDYKLIRKLPNWVEGEIVGEGTGGFGGYWIIRSNIPRKISGFWHFDVNPKDLNGRFGGMIIRKP